MISSLLSEGLSGTAEKIEEDIKLTVIRSSKNDGRTIKIGISGSVKKIDITGESLPINLGLDKIDMRLVQSVLPKGRIHRSDGFGKDVPTGVIMAIEKAVLAKLATVKEAGDGIEEASDEALIELLKTDKGKKMAANAIWSDTQKDSRGKRSDGTRTVNAWTDNGPTESWPIDGASEKTLLKLLKQKPGAMSKLKLGESVDTSELDLEDEYTKMVVSLIESAGGEIFLVEMNDAKMDTFFVVFRSILIQYDKALNEKERTNNNARLGLWIRALNKAMDHVKGMEENDETVKKLRVAITKEFISDYPPGSKFIRVIDNYLNKGQFPKIPISKELKAQIAAEKAAKKALKNSPKTTPKPEMSMAAESVSGSLSSQLQEAFTGNVPASAAKKWASSIVTEIKRQITTKQKPKSIIVAKSEVSYPRSWDYAMNATVKVTLPSDEEIDVKYYVNIAETECSGSVDLPSKWGGVLATARSQRLDEVTKRLTSEVAHRFTVALRTGDE